MPTLGGVRRAVRGPVVTALAGALRDHLRLAALGEGDLDEVEIARGEAALELRLASSSTPDVVAGGDVDEGEQADSASRASAAAWPAVEWPSPPPAGPPLRRSSRRGPGGSAGCGLGGRMAGSRVPGDHHGAAAARRAEDVLRGHLAVGPGDGLAALERAPAGPSGTPRRSAAAVSNSRADPPRPARSRAPRSCARRGSCAPRNPRTERSPPARARSARRDSGRGRARGAASGKAR